MQENITFVYYNDNDELDAFHITDSHYAENLHGQFLDRDVQMIHHITIEQKDWKGRTFETLFTEKDIAAFIKTRKLDY